ncbi:MAG: hypothetical protein U5L00_09050 [Desulfovermiculus sp.]|nr:hypothetical protein [Desulfovermiculus sp.]
MTQEEKTAIPGSWRSRFIWILAAGLLILLGAEVFIHKHPPFAWAGTYGFFAGYGFFSSVLLVLVAKGVRLILMRNKDYYDPHPDR